MTQCSAPAWVRRVQACAFVTPLQGRIPDIDLEENLRVNEDMILLLAAAFAKYHCDRSPHEKPEPPSLCKKFIDLFDTELGHDHIGSAIEKVYKKMIIDETSKSAGSIRIDYVTFGVKLSVFQSLVDSEIRSTNAKLPTWSALRHQVITHLESKFDHSVATKGVMLCENCGRVFSRSKSSKVLEARLLRRYNEKALNSQCLSPVAGKSPICHAVESRNIFCGMRLVGDAL